LDGGTPISPALTLSGNTASFSISSLALGVHTITAQYSGDKNHLAAVSLPTSVTIVIPPDFNFTLSNAVLRLDDDRTQADTMALVPIGAYSGTISFSCSGLPRNTVCTFAPSSVALAGGQSQSAALRIHRTGGNEDSTVWRGDAGNDGEQHNFTVTVTATDGVISHRAVVTLVVGD
jgi:hypothetical protein